MGDEVQFTDEQWETVARAAETFAEVLKDSREALADVLVTNWAGECGEGLGTMENLRTLLQGDGPSSFAGAVSSEMQYLHSLAAQCRTTGKRLSEVDGSVADDFKIGE